VISPISCDDSPSRLIRFEVSWIWSRIEFMPPIVFCTACRPDSAACSDCCGDVGRFLRLGRDLVDAASHLQHRFAGVADLAQLLGRRREQLGRVRLDLLGRRRHPAHRALHLRHQGAQLLDRVVHRVGDRAGDVLGHRRLLRQVAFGNALQLVHQAKNRRLVGVVDALGLLLLRPRPRGAALRERRALALVADVQAQEP
jgi:hypothetical protein